LSVHEAKKRGYAGVVAATSGNYGAAIASQAAKAGLRCIVVQEAFDSRGIAQPEIAEKTRACEAYGAEVIRLSVGPELFYVFLRVLKETGYFNASLYTPYSILGIETLGYEHPTSDEANRKISRRRSPRTPGSNVTGTTRPAQGRRAGNPMIAASVVSPGSTWPRIAISIAILYHRPHRLFDPFHDVAGSRRRAAQRRPAAALYRSLRHRHSRRGLLHHRSARRFGGA
jgi:hypothetical protein